MQDKVILVVDEDPLFQTLIKKTLEFAGYAVIMVDSGEKAIEMVRQEQPDLVLLDASISQMSGFEVCKTLRAHESNNLMPIIMLSSKDDLDDKLEGLELGADDFITKPFSERELLSRIRNTFVRIERNRSANPLTGLPGNLEIQRLIDSCVSKSDLFAVLYLDLDYFKSYNDVYGFFNGDHMIRLVADIITSIVPLFGNENDFCGHIGGDDFVVITTPDKVEMLCTEILALFEVRSKSLFKQEDLEKGFIETLNRKGVLEENPLTSLSIAVVTNERRKFESHLQVAAVAAEVKKMAKAMGGNSYFIDRRSDDTPLM